MGVSFFLSHEKEIEWEIRARQVNEDFQKFDRALVEKTLAETMVFSQVNFPLRARYAYHLYRDASILPAQDRPEVYQQRTEEFKEAFEIFRELEGVGGPNCTLIALDMSANMMGHKELEEAYKWMRLGVLHFENSYGRTGVYWRNRMNLAKLCYRLGKIEEAKFWACGVLASRDLGLSLGDSSLDEIREILSSP